MARILGDEDMNSSFFVRVLYPAAMFFLTGMPPMTFSALAETTKVEGFIQARDGETMVLRTADSHRLVVVLNDSTQVGQVQGVFKARRKEMSMTALIPGLQVKVEGEYTDPGKMIAASISFKGNDLERAQAMQAGMHESHMQLEKHEARLAANQSAIAEAVARFGQLDDYYIFDEVTVYFGNGKTKVDPKYVPQLLALAEKAKPINGYMIEIKGYASLSGSTELNQQLSEDRADEVTNILIQQGHVPLTRLLAPGAMGESHQVNNNDGEQAEAANRRVVVRILQNKAVAGT